MSTPQNPPAPLNSIIAFQIESSAKCDIHPCRFAILEIEGAHLERPLFFETEWQDCVQNLPIRFVSLAAYRSFAFYALCDNSFGFTWIASKTIAFTYLHGTLGQPT
jgi:hypothetical protein